MMTENKAARKVRKVRAMKKAVAAPPLLRDLLVSMPEAPAEMATIPTQSPPVPLHSGRVGYGWGQAGQGDGGREQSHWVTAT